MTSIYLSTLILRKSSDGHLPGVRMEYFTTQEKMERQFIPTLQLGLDIYLQSLPDEGFLEPTSQWAFSWFEFVKQKVLK